MRLTQEEKEFIRKNSMYSLRNIQTLFFREFGRKLSLNTLSKHRGKVNTTIQLPTTPPPAPHPAPPTPHMKKTPFITRIRPEKRKIAYPTTLHQFQALLDKNPNHPYTKYFRKRVFGDRKPSASDFRKFFEFIRDVNQL